MLEVRDLVKKYKIGKKSKKRVTALNKVSITFPETGLIFLLGKSGSGKSTLLNAIGGLDEFDSGEIIIKGRSSKDFSQSDFDSYRNTFIGFIFQEYNVLEEFTVAKNLALAIELQGKTATKEAVNELLEMVEMQDFAKRKPNQLSGGQKQRVAIARALIKNPEIIMADEPTGALDSNTGKQVMETLKKLSEKKLVIIVSHDREFAEIYGDRIIELKDGKIISDVTKKEIEAKKTESGISIIENELIHIKKGQKFTEEDIKKLCKAIVYNSQKADTIISLSSKANEEIKKANSITDDGNKEVFLNTEKEDVVTKEYSSKDFKLIKSRLKFKDSFKMGASALKNKVFKLVFTIFLSFIAFAMFGIIDTFSTFNRPAAMSHTIESFNKTEIELLKEKKGEYSNYVTPFKQSDIDYIKENFPGIDIKPVVSGGMRFNSNYNSSSYSNPIMISNLSYNSNNIAKVPYYSGMVYMSEAEMQQYGLNLVAGRYPSATENNEICISKHQYDCLKELNPTLNLEYDNFLSEYNSCQLGYNYYEDNNYKIVGIIDDGSDLSEYMNLDNSQISSDYLLNQKVTRDLDFGFENIIYINQSLYEEKLNKTLDVDFHVNANGEYAYINYGIGNAKTLQEMYSYERFNGYQEFLDIYEFYYKNGDLYIENEGYAELEDNEILISNEIFVSLFGDVNKEELINGVEPLTVTLKGIENYEDGWSIENYSTIKTFTIVGCYNINSSYAFVANKSTIESIKSHSYYGFVLEKNSDYYNIGFDSCYTLETLKQIYYGGGINYTKEEYVANRILYLKSGVSIINNGQFLNLGKNDIILSENSVSSLAQGQDLYDLIEEGVTINFSTDYDGEDVVLSYNLVGISSGIDYAIVSEDALNDDSFKDAFSGFDYAIASLSNDKKINDEFIKMCERFNDDDVKYTIQMGSTPILDNFEDILNSISEVFFYIGIAFAVFASLLLMNFISTSISYKKREIGILRALGARSKDVFGIFFNESLIIAGINFVLAAVATIVTCVILNGIIIKDLGLEIVMLSVGIRQLALLAGVSVITAFIASFFPVYRIAKKKPIDAINNR